MDLQDLEARLNDREYKNWLKAARCLHLLKEGLHPLISHHMRAFHKDLLQQNSLLRKPCQTSCRPKGNTLSSVCRLCSEWQAVILRHHRQQGTVTVNWGNCHPPNWRTDYWELAKAYMPRGQTDVKAADQCDASALLNLINYCNHFQSVDLKCVKEVIRYRNELMHSGEFRVKDGWMRGYQTSLKNVVRQFSHVPQMKTVGQQIQEMLTVDLSICVSGLDRMDGSSLLKEIEADSVHQISGDMISQWEAELLQERLQELLRVAKDDAAEDNANTKTQAAEQLKALGGFLQANRDLAERFSAELQAIKSLEAKEEEEERGAFAAIISL